MSIQEWVGRQRKRYCMLLHPREGLRYLVDFIEQQEDGTYHYDTSVWAYYLDETGKQTPSHVHWISDSIELFRNGLGRCVNCGNFHKPYAEKMGFTMCEPCMVDKARSLCTTALTPAYRIREYAEQMGWEII